MHVTFLIKSALLLSTLLVCVIRPAAAQTAECPTARPSVRTAPDRIGEVRAYPAAAPADTLRSDTAAKRPGLIRRIIDYYSRSNVDRTFEKKIDWSIAPGPNYSSDVGFGIGFLLAGLYRLDRADSVTAPSNVSIYGNITTQKFVLLRFSGDNLFNHNRQRLSYSGPSSISREPSTASATKPERRVTPRTSPRRWALSTSPTARRSPDVSTSA